MGGETIDVRKDIAGWNKVGCTNGDWLPVVEVAAPEGEATAQSCPPNRIHQIIPVVACTAMSANNWVLDSGSNLTGWLKLRLPAVGHAWPSGRDRGGEMHMKRRLAWLMLVFPLPAAGGAELPGAVIKHNKIVILHN